MSRRFRGVARRGRATPAAAARRVARARHAVGGARDSPQHRGEARAAAARHEAARSLEAGSRRGRASAVIVQPQSRSTPATRRLSPGEEVSPIPGFARWRGQRPGSERARPACAGGPLETFGRSPSESVGLRGPSVARRLAPGLRRALGTRSAVIHAPPRSLPAPAAPDGTSQLSGQFRARGSKHPGAKPGAVAPHRPPRIPLATPLGRPVSKISLPRIRLKSSTAEGIRRNVKIRGMSDLF
jgi:hypothetical protein